MLSTASLEPVSEWHSLDQSQKTAALQQQTPVVLRHFVKHWPLVKAAKQSFSALRNYLLFFDNRAVYQAMIAPPQAEGRLGYRADMSDVNFERMNGHLDDALTILDALDKKAEAPAFYIGSTCVADVLPGMEKENDLSCINAPVSPNIWIGSPAVVATHNDDAQNIACVAAGRRRFTLFPPEQEENLYIGPADITPAGRPISLVDLHNPDFTRFPRFRRALEQAQVVELDAGDALYIPTGWWHHVESLAPVNLLMNFWWKGAPPRLA